MSWYDCIESGIRKEVRLLRDNGFNTICSCEHDKTIEIDLLDATEAHRLYLLLFNSGYKDFHITTTTRVPPNGMSTDRAVVDFTGGWLSNA